MDGGGWVVATQVGSGKSSLLAALLAEITPTGGANTLPLVRGSMAYCAQQPWIIAGTLRDNILFGLAYDPVRYQKTLEGCALVDDIGALPAGDLTELGERGINLSGGQKVRVAEAFAPTRKLDASSGRRSAPRAFKHPAGRAGLSSVVHRPALRGRPT
jgi:ATP-binding cassette subfamily C (CFTR/MRP) protein 1